MKLDDRLQQITRVQWDEQARLQQKKRLMVRVKRKQLFAPRFALVTIACILLLFYLMDIRQPVQPQQQAQLTDELAKITVLLTDKPERNLNLNSASYVNKKVTTDKQLLAKFQRIVTASTVVEQAWDGQLTSPENIYQLLLTFQNDKQLYLKFGSHSGVFELYDVYGQKKYVLTNGTELILLLQQIADETATSSDWKKYLWGILIVLLLIDAAFISKNRYNRDDYGNKKSLHWSWRILYTIIFMMAFVVSYFYLGTTHAGILCGGIMLTIVLQEYLEVKQGIKRANWLWTSMTIFFVLLVVLLFVI
ncbi:hypothetical protein [Metasolibacillus sp.]|uniref:hypothetical protein n=1 Tax=Metasolibacillus sp. TaxID=2703680 RepID=UPI0025EA4A34|nr:hypothetical protein [Metasolibacillus sp.]MCT6922677.1 hypothetical protein [Metasolibacillus sp.]MCT6938984.1 hypothetical protein [Metasolibacillus sp.]